MRVLHCIPSMLGGGAERQLCYLAGGLARLGHEVHVAVAHAGPNSARLEASGATVHALAVGHAFDPRRTLELVSLTHRVRAEIVHTWLTMMDFHGGAAARLCRLPWVASERATSLEVATAGLWRERARRSFVRGASAVVANSENGARFWRHAAAVGGSPRIVEVIENALPLDELETVTPVTRVSLGLAAEDEVVLFVGRFAPEKNVGLLAQTARLVLARRPRARLLCCGDGPDLQSFVDALNEFAPRVDRLGYRTDVWSIMKIADLLLSTSSTEGQPNAVLEAMACGCPVVVSDIPQHRDIVPEHGGTFFALGAPHEAAAAIDALLDERARRDSRAALAWQAMRSRSIETLAARHVDLYARILAK